MMSKYAKANLSFRLADDAPYDIITGVGENVACHTRDALDGTGYGVTDETEGHENDGLDRLNALHNAGTTRRLRRSGGRRRSSGCGCGIGSGTGGSSGLAKGFSARKLLWSWAAGLNGSRHREPLKRPGRTGL